MQKTFRRLSLKIYLPKRPKVNTFVQSKSVHKSVDLCSPKNIAFFMIFFLKCEMLLKHCKWFVRKMPRNWGEWRSRSSYYSVLLFCKTSDTYIGREFLWKILREFSCQECSCFFIFNLPNISSVIILKHLFWSSIKILQETSL